MDSTWGDLLACDGQTSICLVNESGPGRLVIGASRTGGAGAIDVVGTRSLVRLIFRATQAGDSPLGFDNMALSDPQQEIHGVEWYGGTLFAN
jgi:hypothetical protein